MVMAKIRRFPLGRFTKQFSTEAQCREYLADLRWSSGYVCPKCGSRHAYRLANGRYDHDSGLLHWLHIVISNAKAFILGPYHGLPKKYLQSYLDEYSFRFSRRGFGGALVERLSLSIVLSRLAEQKGITTFCFSGVKIIFLYAA